MSIKERLDTLSRGELAGLIAVLVVTLAGAGLWYTRSLPKPVQIASSAGPVVAGQVGGSGAGGIGLAPAPRRSSSTSPAGCTTRASTSSPPATG